jgi:CheY-like chemotaxis protein
VLWACKQAIFGTKSPAKQGSHRLSRATTLGLVTKRTGSSAGGSPRCVLIVEDDDDSREMLGELVSSFGHRPVSAANAAEALAEVRSQKPDLALIDIGLPGIDGCELARRLRVVINEMPGLHTRLVALTGYSDSAIRESADAAGFDAYVVKPIMPEALEALLAE